MNKEFIFKVLGEGKAIIKLNDNKTKDDLNYPGFVLLAFYSKELKAFNM